MNDGGYTAISLAIGIGMIALTLVINAVSVVVWLKLLARRIEFLQFSEKNPRLFEPIISTAVVLLLVHVVEAFLWAVLYMHLPGHSGLSTFHDAFYFSIITLTTLGYGDVTLSQEWQLLSGLESMVGIVVFGMTTAILFAVVQKCWSVRHH